MNRIQIRSKKRCSSICFCNKTFEVRPTMLQITSKIRAAIERNPIHNSYEDHYLSLAYVSEDLVPLPQAILDKGETLIDDILDYTYTYDARFTEQNYQDLIWVAKEYGLDVLRQRAQNYMLGLNYPERAGDYYQTALKFCCGSAIHSLRRYILENFQLLDAKSNHFAKFTAEELDELLADDLLNVKEDALFQIIKHWTEQVDPKRINLFKHVRFTIMDETIFREKVTCMGNKEVDSLIKMSSDYFDKLTGAKGKRMKSLHEVRVPWEIVLAIKGWSEGGPCTMVEALNINSGKWVQLKTSLIGGHLRLAYHATQIVSGKLFVFGGYSRGDDERDYRKSMIAYDPLTGIMVEKSSMFQERCYLSSTVLNGKIFAFGGFNGHHRFRTAEVYDPDTDTWDALPQMIEIRSDACAVAINSTLYVIGGFNGDQIHDSVEIFDPATNIWRFGPTLQVRRSGVNAAVYHGKIYVVGGYDGINRLKSVEFLDPSTSNSWEMAGELNLPRSNFGLTVAGDKLYAMGGYDGEGVTKCVEVYDEASNSWKICKSMKYPRSALQAITVSGCNFSEVTHCF